MSPLKPIVCLVGLVTAAHADRGELTERSPSTLEPKEVRLGLTDLGVGLWGHELLERVEVFTHHFMWGGWALGVPSYDVGAKFEFWRDPRLSLAIGAELMNVDLTPLVGDEMETQGDDLTFRVVPIELWAGYRVTDRVRLTAGMVYTSVSLGGSTDGGPIDDLGGTVGTSSLEWHATAQVQVGKSWHLIGGGRLLGYQEQWATASGESGGTTGETTVRGDAIGIGRAYTVSLAAHLQRPSFNLRFGVEYGNYHIPFVNFVASDRGFLPMLDVYWRL